MRARGGRKKRTRATVARVAPPRRSASRRWRGMAMPRKSSVRPETMARIALRRNRWPSLTSVNTAFAPRPLGCTRTLPRRLVGMRAASAGSWASALRTSTPRSGTERARRSALCEKRADVGALRGAAEARPEGLRAHDRPRRSHEQGPVSHEVAPLGDRLVGDALGHEAGHPGVARGSGPRAPRTPARRRSRCPRRGGSSPRRGGSPRRRAGRVPPSPRTVGGVLGSWLHLVA